MTTAIYKHTCDICVSLRNLLVSMWLGLIAAGEAAGRARAARELARQGYHAEAKKLMLEMKK